MKPLTLIGAALLSALSVMAVDPNWSAAYNFANSPEQNGFTRVLYGTPTVNTVTSGQAANRRIELGTTGGDCIFLLSSVPSLSLAQGATAEAVVSCSGAGDAGFELTFQGNNAAVQIYTNKITVTVNDGFGEHVCADGLSNATDTTVRITITQDTQFGTVRVYRNTALVATVPMSPSDQPQPRVLFWGESGGTQIFRQMKYYLGGAVAP